MKAIILAAGRGSRMEDLTEERPKCLVELSGKSLLELQLLALREAGIHEIAVVTGYKSELLRDYQLTEFHNPRWQQTNMVSSLEFAKEWLEAGPCIVSYSDIFYETAAVNLLIGSSAPLAITYDPCWLELWKKRFGDPLIDAETFKLNPDGTLAEIGEKPDSAEQVEGQYMGLLRFSTHGWAKVMELRSALNPDEKDSMDMTTMLRKDMKEGSFPVQALPIEGSWGEIDSKKDLHLYDGKSI